MFDGGINTYRDSRKLATNECVSVVNADIVSGSVVSIPNETFVESNTGPVFTEYKNSIVSGAGKYLSYTQMNNLLFRSDGSETQFTDGSRDSNSTTIWKPIGIDTPDDSDMVQVVINTLSDTQANMTILPKDEVIGTSKPGIYNYVFLINGLYYQYNATLTGSCYAVHFRIDIGETITSFKAYRKADNYSKFYLVATNAYFTDLEASSNNTPSGEIPLKSRTFYLSTGVEYYHFDDIIYKGNGIITVQDFGTSTFNTRWFKVDPDEPLFTLNMFTGDIVVAKWKPPTIPYDKTKSYLFGIDAIRTPISGTSPVGHTYNIPDIKQFYLEAGKFLPYSPSISDTDGNSDGLWKFMWANGKNENYGIFTHFSEEVVGFMLYPDGLRYPQQDIDRSDDASVFIRNEVNLKWSDACGNSMGSMDTTESVGTHMIGQFKYRLTYESAEGIETAGGPESTEITSSGGSIKITIPKVDIPNVRYARLYRKSSYEGVGSEYLYMLRFDASMEHTYYDNLSIDELGGLIPNNTTISVPDDLLFLTYYKGRLFGATKGYTYIDTEYLPIEGDEYPSVDVGEGSYYIYNGEGYTFLTGQLAGSVMSTGSKLLFKDGEWVLFGKDDSMQDFGNYTTLIYSELGRPTEWLGLSFINFPETITGIGTCSNGLIIYHKFRCMLLTGTDSDTFSVRDISASQGCINHNSIQQWKDTSICLSKEGLIATDGGSVELITYKKLGVYQPNDIKSSAIVGNDYFLLQDDGYILRYNLQDFTIVTYYKPNIAGLNMIDGSLYMVDSANICYRLDYILGGSSEYSILTGKLTDGALANLKEYDKVRIMIEGYAYITVYIDGKAILYNQRLENGFNMVGIPNERNKGYYIQFGIRGLGKLHSIEYKVGGRTND